VAGIFEIVDKALAAAGAVMVGVVGRTQGMGEGLDHILPGAAPGAGHNSLEAVVLNDPLHPADLLFISIGSRLIEEFLERNFNSICTQCLSSICSNSVNGAP